MKFNISHTQQYITLQDTAEVILTRRLIADRLGEEDSLTKRLGKLVSLAIRDEHDPVQSDFYGDDQHIIVDVLHEQALGEESWPQAQARQMLLDAI